MRDLLKRLERAEAAILQRHHAANCLSCTLARLAEPTEECDRASCSFGLAEILQMEEHERTKATA